MCGIAGFLDLRNHALDLSTARAQLRAMTDAIRHRGPDGEGAWIDGPVALGHRRLSIVDLSPTGAQPMVSASGQLVLTFNGEIYNHRDLRARLEKAGIGLRGTSDTEVLLEAMACWGVERALSEAAGMFAFALWDTVARRLTLARDRMGEKPLYYGRLGNRFVFASELKAIRTLPDFADQIDPQALSQLMHWAHIQAPMTIHPQIRKLRAGEMLHIGPQAPPAAPVRYWRIEDAVQAGLARPFSGTLDQAADELHALLSRAVGEQMQADVPVGAFLSGGVDSSLVVALMQRQSARTVKTFSIGFGEAEFDESDDARRVAQHLGTEHIEMRAAPAQALDVIPQLPAMFDEPFADASQIPTFLVAALARQQVTVSLSGDGGDELFGGYRKYAVGSRLANLPGRNALGSLLGSAPAQVAGSVIGTVPGLRTRFDRLRLDRLAHMLRATPAELATRLSDNCPPPYRVLASAAERAPATFAFAPDLPALPSAPYGVVAALVDLLGYLPDDVLTKVDRASMRVSLESRAPLLDHRIAEWAQSLPWSMRGADGNEKRVMRQLLYRLVPQPLVDRPKMGFSVPIARWLRNELRPWGESLLAEPRATRDGVLDIGRVRQIWNEHQQARSDRSALLWSVLMFLAWRSTT
ncbi:MAG: asparagine synthase (glutamine-hydrolyzing) [Burkholderiaceae bacterium]|nr:asparagine synthase (glutamine-hydrolyzing) [Burkholderiaceae bacterium]